MSEIGNSFIFPRPESEYEKDFNKTTLEFTDQVIKILNRGIIFTDNVDCRTVSYTSNAVANTEDGINHTLGKIPVGYLVINQDKAASVYYGGTAWTTTTINLKCSVATVALTIIVF